MMEIIEGLSFDISLTFNLSLHSLAHSLIHLYTQIMTFLFWFHGWWKTLTKRKWLFCSRHDSHSCHEEWEGENSHHKWFFYIQFNKKKKILSFQYSLIQMVVEACQKKRTCKFLSSPKTFGGDPCPGHRKFIEVAYKCRPSK